jgi:phospholipase D3/4
MRFISPSFNKNKLCLLIFTLVNICSIFAQVELNCYPNASYTVVESIPQQVKLWTNVTTFQAWKELIDSATSTLDLGFYYINLSEGELFPPQDEGINGSVILAAIIAAKERGVYVRYVQNEPGPGMEDYDSKILAKAGIDVRSINWTQFFDGNGILHTKMMVVDNTHVYIGSANLDWCSLAQVKELGVVIRDCPALAEDALKEFNQYWLAANRTTLPNPWPVTSNTNINMKNPAEVVLNDMNVTVFISASPKEFCPPNRTNDIDALLHVVNSSNKTICVEVMDYSASSLYDNPNIFWPDIQDALTAAAFNRGVKVQLLFSLWNHTTLSTFQFIKGLNDIDNIEVKMMIIPPLVGEKPVPFTRVQHGKFMVTEEYAYVGTNNWTEDYFTNTGGLSYTFKNPQIVNDIQSRFDRDWNSPYSIPLDELLKMVSNRS